jgi:hypothetical protein
MRILKWVFGLIAVVAVALIAIGMILPRQVNVARSIEIAAPADKIFPHINSLKEMAEWSPWMGRDPAMQVSYNEVEAGEGAAMEWASEQRDVGNGRQEIVASAVNESVTTALDFGDMGLAEAKLALVETDGGTMVTWTLDSDMGMSPIGRWMGVMMDSWVGGDYEQGLANLKTLVEE